MNPFSTDGQNPVDRKRNECKMKVWIDILTPKQANFLGELHHRLEAKGIKTFLTTREYREVNQLLELKGLKSTPVGRHGGGELKDKLMESSKRILALSEIVEDESPDVAISFSSPEAARVSFGFKIPHYCISDSPHAEAVSKLTIPLSQKLFTPWIIPIQAWTRYGITDRDVVKYRALDPIAWLSHYKSTTKVLDVLKINSSRPIITIRPPEEFAAYLSDRNVAITDKATDVVAKILDLDAQESQIVVLPRYNVQKDRFRKRFGNRVIVPDHVIDSISLINASSVFLGGGGNHDCRVSASWCARDFVLPR